MGLLEVAEYQTPDKRLLQAKLPEFYVLGQGVALEET